MVPALNNGIAKILAILFGACTLNNSVAAQDLTLPEQVSESVALRGSDTRSGSEIPSGSLQIFVGTVDDCCEDRTPLAGQYTLFRDVLTFKPAFGFEAGQGYVARTQRPGDVEKLTPFRLPQADFLAKAEVTEIYPSGDTLPENTLRYYLHFSVPMKPQVAYEFINLRDASGTVDDAAFMRFKQELWDETRTRLTVLIDPGRIKRGVATNRKLGPALLAGERYTLSVEEGWPSADGASVLPGFSKTFLVSDPLRTTPDAQLWKVNSPCATTREPLEVTFDRPFDRHLLTKHLKVRALPTEIVEGEIEVGVGERTWRFTPQNPWPQQGLYIHVDAALEDVAGNNFLELLDHAVNMESTGRTTAEVPIVLARCSG